MSEQTGQPQRAGQSGNPWLAGMLGAALLSLLAGVSLYAGGRGAANDRFAEPGDGQIPALIGGVLTSAGVLLLVAYLAAAAVCWQLRNRG